MGGVSRWPYWVENGERGWLDSVHVVGPLLLVLHVT